MNGLGIVPVLQGYSGMVPRDFKEKYPDADVIDQGMWCGFVRPSILNSTDPMFDNVASIFYQEQNGIFGDITHFYATDPFHEGGSVEGLNVAEFGKLVQRKMLDADAEAIWVLQGWGTNPKKEMLDGVDKNRILVLNLLGGRQPLWKITDGFYGAPWVWCTIHNYGGRSGLYGFLRVLAREPVYAASTASGKSMVGIGITPEAIETNPVFYDLMTEMAWRSEAPDVTGWINNYIERRYGKKLESAEKAWELLEETVYNSFVRQPGAVESVICARPKEFIQNVSSWGPKGLDYDQELVKQACIELFKCYEELKGSEGYLYDLVDVTRQVVANIARHYHERLMYAYKQKDLARVEREGRRLLDLILVQDKLLGSKKEFLLGNWLSQARKLGSKYNA